MTKLAEIIQYIQKFIAKIDLNKLQEFISIDKKDAEYSVLMMVLYLVFLILPFLIFFSSLVYVLNMMSFQQMVSKKNFFADDIIFTETENIYGFFGNFFISDFLLLLLILCSLFLICMVYIFYASKTNKISKSVDFMDWIKYIGLLLFLCILIFSFNIGFDLSGKDSSQELGMKRDQLNQLVHNYVNIDYLHYLHDTQLQSEECQKKCTVDMVAFSYDLCPCRPDLINSNTLKNLVSYIADILKDVPVGKTLSPTTTYDEFKTWEHEGKQQKYCDLVINAIMTYALLNNLKNLQYQTISGKTLDKSFFENKESVFQIISYRQSNLTNIDPENFVSYLGETYRQHQISKEILSICLNNQTETTKIILELKHTTTQKVLPNYAKSVIPVFLVSCFYYGMSYKQIFKKNINQ